MTVEALELAISALCPGAGYCIAPEVLVKPGLPRRVEIKLHVWLKNRTLIYSAATLEALLASLESDLAAGAPSRVVLGDLARSA